MLSSSSSSENRSSVTVDSWRVVGMMPARVVEIVPVRLVPLAVVEIVPVRVVEMVPVLVVEMIPPFAKVGADIARTSIVEQMIDFAFFIVLLLVASNVRGNLVGLKVLPAEPIFGPTSNK